MSTSRTPYLEGLIHELVKLPREVEWVEFKHNNDNSQMIGEYISALANAAALAGKSKGYLLWGEVWSTFGSRRHLLDASGVPGFSFWTWLGRLRFWR